MNSCPITQWGRWIERWSNLTSYPAAMAISGRGRIWPDMKIWPDFGRGRIWYPVQPYTEHKLHTSCWQAVWPSSCSSGRIAVQCHDSILRTGLGLASSWTWAKHFRTSWCCCLWWGGCRTGQEISKRICIDLAWWRWYVCQTFTSIPQSGEIPLGVSRITIVLRKTNKLQVYTRFKHIIETT